MKRGFCSFRQRVSLFLSTASRVHGPHSFQAQSHPKAHSSLCPQMQKPAGDHQKGKPSSRDVNQAEWPLAMARAPIWSRNTALPRSPSYCSIRNTPTPISLLSASWLNIATPKDNRCIFGSPTDLHSNFLRPPNYRP